MDEDKNPDISVAQMLDHNLDNFLFHGRLFRTHGHPVLNPASTPDVRHPTTLSQSDQLGVSSPQLN